MLQNRWKAITALAGGVLLALTAGVPPAPRAQAQDTGGSRGELVDRLLAAGLTREEMVGLYQALAGAQFQPPPCVAGQEMFTDVPASNPVCPWIEEMARRGITGGCNATAYCPDNAVTRAQMAVFIVRSMAQLPKVGTVVLNNMVIDGGPVQLANFTTTVPADGLLVVTVEGATRLDYDAPGVDSVTSVGSIGLCVAADTLDGASCGPPLNVWSQDPDNADNDNSTNPFSITRVIPVTAGDVTLYLNAQNSSPGTFGTGTVVATVIWMADTGALGVVAGP